MATEVYGLWPKALDRLAARTGKLYLFLVATIAATNEGEARRLAMEQDTLGLPWDDPEQFECKTVATFGDRPPAGTVFFQWTPA